MHTDLYADLGVEKTADASEIKRAFRKLTQRFHPDKNPGNQAAAERFKAVARAWDVLGDAQKRDNYDEFGAASLAHNFDLVAARAVRDAMRQQELLHAQFARTEAVRREQEEALRRAAIRRGDDIHSEFEVPFLTALRGGAVTFNNLQITIPRGTGDGAKFKISGHGHPGMPAQDPRQRGDLILTAIVSPTYPDGVAEAEALITRKGLDLHMPIEVTWYEICRGGHLTIPTPWGPYIVHGDRYDGITTNHFAYMQMVIPDMGVRCACVGACQHQKGTLYCNVQQRPPARDQALLDNLQRLQANEHPRERLVRAFSVTEDG